MGAHTQDTHLDKLREEIDAELVAPPAARPRSAAATAAAAAASGSLVGSWGALVAGLCISPRLLGAAPGLRASALLALCKLMALDGRYCEDNCPLFFTLLQRRWAGCALRLAWPALVWPVLVQFSKHAGMRMCRHVQAEGVREREGLVVGYRGCLVGVGVIVACVREREGGIGAGGKRR